jgi:hypothetical protein
MDRKGGVATISYLSGQVSCLPAAAIPAGFSALGECHRLTVRESHELLGAAALTAPNKGVILKVEKFCNSPSDLLS